MLKYFNVRITFSCRTCPNNRDIRAKKNATMLSISTVPTIKGYLLLMVFGYSMSASNRRCLPIYEGGSFCFTQPDPPVNMSWSSAMQWCKNINATLPILNSSYHYSVYQNALGYFGLQAETLWLGANSTYDPDNWFWTDGSRFTGDIERSNTTYQINGFVMRNGSALKFGATNTSDYNYYICRVDYSELECASNANTFWTNSKCFFKHSNPWYSRVSWYSFVSNCGQSNIPSHDDLKELSRWLDQLERFWIGLRCGWWTWHNMVTGISFEMIQKAGFDFPHIAYGQCLASHRTSYGSFNWINLDCNRELQFVCQEHMNAIRTETTAKQLHVITTVSKKTTFTVEETTSSFNVGQQTEPSNWGSLTGVFIALIVAVGVGSGFLLVVAIRAIYKYRQKRVARYSPMDLPTKSESNSNPTSRNAFDNYTFNVASGTVGRMVARNPYKPVNAKANEHAY